MKYNKSRFLTGGMILVLVGLILAAGCSSSTTPSKNEAVVTIKGTDSGDAVQTYEQTTGDPVVTATTTIPTTTVILSNGITMAYPVTWEMDELSDTSLRDYGRVTTNIVNFFSPIYADDTYITVSVDVDPETISDNDRYFNLATVAVQKTFGTIEITHHTQSATYQIFHCSECKTYNLEFEADLETRTDSEIDISTLQRWYHFIDADGTFYIITINNPGLAYDQVYEMLKSIRITAASTGKHR